MRVTGDELLAQQIKLAVAAGELPEPQAEFRFHAVRRWRFDFAFPGKVALEYEGGVHTNGRHVRAAGYTEDCRKYSEAALDGWCVVRATWEMVLSGEAMELVMRAINIRQIGGRNEATGNH